MNKLLNYLIAKEVRVNNSVSRPDLSPWAQTDSGGGAHYHHTFPAVAHCRHYQCLSIVWFRNPASRWRELESPSPLAVGSRSPGNAKGMRITGVLPGCNLIGQSLGL
jgi:hypothetical protein